MKTITFFKLSVILAFAAFLCISCDKDEVNKNAGSFTCKIDGTNNSRFTGMVAGL
jgi:hypothetical protein